MKSVIVVVLLLGLAAGQYVQKEPVIQVVQVKAAITEVHDEVKYVLEEDKKAETIAEVKVEEVIEAENPFARPAEIKNTKSPMTYEQILRDGEANPDFQQEGPKFKRQKHQKKHPRNKEQKPLRANADQSQEEDVGFDTGLVLPVLIGLAVVIFLVKICTKRGKCNKRRLRQRMQRVNMETSAHQNNNNIQLETIQPIDQSIQFHQAEIRRLKNAYQHLHPHSQQLQ